MLKLVLALLALFGYVPKGPADIFTLFEHGHYKEAIQLLNSCKYYDVLKTINDKEQTLLTSVILNGLALKGHYTPEQATIILEEALDALHIKTGYDTFFINQRDVHWQTPLMHAAFMGDEHSATVLFMYGADPRIKDIYGKSAREYAKGELREQMKAWEWQTLEMLREPYNIWRLLRAGAHSSIIEQSLSVLNGHDIYLLRDSVGNNLILGAIIYAYMAGKHDISAQEQYALIIIEHAYNQCSQAFKDEFLDMQNSRGQTALMWASKRGYSQVIKWLLEHNADTHVQDKLGRTLADYDQATHHKAELIELLQ